MEAQSPHFLFRVVDTFALEGRAEIILAPEASLPADIHLRLGDLLEVRTPTGQRFTAAVHSFEMPNPNPRRTYPISLKGVTDKAQVPIGSEVWTTKRISS